MYYSDQIDKTIFKYLSQTSPNASATIVGGEKYSDIWGTVEFYQLQDGVMVVADINNLPQTQNNIFAFHIHEGSSCENNFIETGGHYNPNSALHPNHSGDLPPLFSNNGNAWQAVFTDRFDVKQIIEKTIVIHENVDDFTSQPAGNSGEKIACGIIKSH